MSDKKERSTIKDHFIVKKIREVTKGIKIPGYKDLSLYKLSKIYANGLVKGALTSRAGSVAFSFFMAFFPFLLFMLNVIPFIPIAHLNETFTLFMESLMPDSSKGFFMSIYQDIQENRHGGLLSSSFLMSIIFMGNGVNSLFSAFQGSHHVQISRPFIRKYLYAIFIGLLISLLLILSIIILCIVWDQHFRQLIKPRNYWKWIWMAESGWIRFTYYNDQTYSGNSIFLWNTWRKKRAYFFDFRIYNGRNVHLEHLTVRSIYQHLFEL